VALLRGVREPEGRPVHVDFRGPWWLRPARTEVPGLSTAAGGNAFRIVSLRANGVDVGDSFIATAKLGDSIRFDVGFEYTTVHSTANYIVGAMPSWGKRDVSAIRLAGLPRPVVNAWRTVSFAVGSPQQAGEHYVVILMDMEDTVEHMFSGTSWKTGEPVWNDGNDILDHPREVFEDLRRSGQAVAGGKLNPQMRTRLGEFRVGDSLVTRDADSAGGGPNVLMGRAILVRYSVD
jgi:hypothetical protein